MSFGRSSSTADATASPRTVLPTSNYVGRFAPSPTGLLHAGSLLAALGSYLDARHHHGRWLLRIEDLDPPRTEPGASDGILTTLDRHGLHWDSAVVYQSSRADAYAAALASLHEQQRLFYCTCSRLALAPYPNRYPGTCRARSTPPSEPAAIRVRIDNEPILLNDLVHGTSTWNLASAPGDFVVRRKEGLLAYQLAVVVDDAAANVTHVVRGSDLLDNTPRQQYLQTLLDLRAPCYLHLPLVLGADGAKLSKQNHAAPLDNAHASENLRSALIALGQPPPSSLTGAPPAEVLQWATLAWQRATIPRMLVHASDHAGEHTHHSRPPDTAT